MLLCLLLLSFAGPIPLHSLIFQISSIDCKDCHHRNDAFSDGPKKNCKFPSSTKRCNGSAARRRQRPENEHPRRPRARWLSAARAKKDSRTKMEEPLRKVNNQMRSNGSLGFSRKPCEVGTQKTRPPCLSPRKRSTNRHAVDFYLRKFISPDFMLHFMLTILIPSMLMI